MRNSSKTLLFLFSGTIMTFAQVGNVGINTDSPSNALHVVSTANALRLQGLQTGATTDNLLTVDATGVVRQNSSVKGLLVGTYTAFGTNPVTITQGNTALIPGLSITFTPDVNATAIISVSALPVPAAASNPVQGSIDLLQNGIKVSSQYYSASDGNPNTGTTGLVNLGNYTTTTRQINLNAGTAYTFTVQAKSWRASTIFNTIAYPNYGGSTVSDTDAMKAIMNISLFTR